MRDGYEKQEKNKNKKINKQTNNESENVNVRGKKFHDNVRNHNHYSKKKKNK